MRQTPTTASLTSQRAAQRLSGVSSRERKQPARPVHTLTGTRKDVCIFLIGAQQSHQLRGLHVIQGEEADVILGGRRATVTHSCIPKSSRTGAQFGVKPP